MRTVRIERNAAEDLHDWLGSEMAFCVTNDDTGGRVSAQLTRAKANSSNPPHCHGSEDEVFYIISGSAIARNPGVEHELHVGDLVWLPRGLPHQLAVGPDGAEILTLLSPGAIEGAFRAVAADPRPKTLRAEMIVWGVEILPELQPFEHPLAPGPSEPRVVRANEGNAYWLAGDTYTVKVPGAWTGGRFCVVHFDIPPGRDGDSAARLAARVPQRDG